MEFSRCLAELGALGRKVEVVSRDHVTVETTADVWLKDTCDFIRKGQVVVVTEEQANELLLHGWAERGES